MDAAYKADLEAMAEGRVAAKKLKMLADVIHLFKQKQLQIKLLDFDVLKIIAHWLEPLEDGSLPSLTIRTAILKALADLPVAVEHLKRGYVKDDAATPATATAAAAPAGAAATATPLRAVGPTKPAPTTLLLRRRRGLTNSLLAPLSGPLGK